MKFALKFNLCIMVAGTGHDYLGRHSCQDGLFIRTSLLNQITWDLHDLKGLGHEEGGSV